MEDKLVQPHKQAGTVVPVLNSAHHDIIRGSEDIAAPYKGKQT